MDGREAIGGGFRYDACPGTGEVCVRVVSKADMALATEPFLSSTGSVESIVGLRVGSWGFCGGVIPGEPTRADDEGLGGSLGILAEGIGRDEEDASAFRVGGGGANPLLTVESSSDPR